MAILEITQDEQQQEGLPDPYMELWASVVSQAVQDTQARDPKGKPTGEAHRALGWFLSDLDGIGSFRWICHSFGADYDKAISTLHKRGILKGS